MDHLLSAESVIAVEGSFWGALNHAAMVHRLQAPLMDTLLTLFLPRCLSQSMSTLFLTLSLSLALRCMLSVILFFVSLPFVYE